MRTFIPAPLFRSVTTPEARRKFDRFRQAILGGDIEYAENLFRSFDFGPLGQGPQVEHNGIYLNPLPFNIEEFEYEPLSLAEAKILGDLRKAYDQIKVRPNADVFITKRPAFKGIASEMVTTVRLQNRRAVYYYTKEGGIVFYGYVHVIGSTSDDVVPAIIYWVRFLIKHGIEGYERVQGTLARII